MTLTEFLLSRRVEAVSASDADAVDHAAEHYAETGSTVCWCEDWKP